jgi:hypothetical protein
MVLISFIGSPQQKRAIGCPGSYLGCSAAVMALADISQRNRHVRFTRKSGHPQCTNSPLSANTGHRVYSITSSARVSSEAGIVMPSALAVFILITVSNFVGACTGKSDGFSPFNTRTM